MAEMFDRRDWLTLAATVAGLIAVLIWRYAQHRPRALGASVQATSGLSWLAWSAIGLVVLVLLGTAVAIGRRVQQKRQAMQRQAEIIRAVASGPTVVLLPRSDAGPVDPGKINLWDRLADALPHDEHVAFEIGGNEEQIGFQLHGSEKGVQAVLTQFRSEWPGLQRRPVEENEELTQLPGGWHIWWCECAPMTWDKPISPLSDDPLRAVLIELKGVMGQGRGLLQIIARNDFGTRKALGERAFAARADRPDNAGVRAIRTREAKEFETRAQRTFLQATVRTVGIADTLERAQGIARGMGRAVAASFGHSNPVRVQREGDELAPVVERRMGFSAAWGGHELAYLGHLVGANMLSLAPRLRVASARSLPADPAMRVVARVDTVALFEEADNGT